MIKLGSGIQSFEVRINTYNNKELWILHTDGSSEDVSVKHCTDNYGKLYRKALEQAHKKDLASVFRNAIKYQRDEFKQFHFSEGKSICAECGNIIIQLHVDHHEPQFRKQHR